MFCGCLFCGSKKAINVANKVTIYYWYHPKGGSKYLPHIALRIPPSTIEKTGTQHAEQYISFGFPRNDGPGFAVQAVKGEWYNFEHDSRYEKAGYQRKECSLYTLNVNKMHNLLDKIRLKDNEISWELVGSLCSENKHNCASICYALLKEGGISKMLPLCSCHTIIHVTIAGVGTVLGIVGGLLYDLYAEEPRGVIGNLSDEGIGAIIGLTAGAAISISLWCGGYCVCCCLKGVDHISRPEGVFGIAEQAVSKEKNEYNIPPVLAIGGVEESVTSTPAFNFSVSDQTQSPSISLSASV
ncbi:MAG TPA: hypothetical protein CFH84_02785 [Sulfurimonas sp. UBA12504]|nr:MAG TPA: hypothetical protein CFH84_02785 [Sulfurimonas sp. UBA12504]